MAQEITAKEYNVGSRQKSHKELGYSRKISELMYTRNI